MEDELLGAYALAGLSLNMALMNLLNDKGVITSQEAEGLFRFAKSGLQQAMQDASDEDTQKALAVLDRLGLSWKGREQKH